MFDFNFLFRFRKLRKKFREKTKKLCRSKINLRTFVLYVFFSSNSGWIQPSFDNQKFRGFPVQGWRTGKGLILESRPRFSHCYILKMELCSNETLISPKNYLIGFFGNKFDWRKTNALQSIRLHVGQRPLSLQWAPRWVSWSRDRRDTEEISWSTQSRSRRSRLLLCGLPLSQSMKIILNLFFSKFGEPVIQKSTWK